MKHIHTIHTDTRKKDIEMCTFPSVSLVHFAYKGPLHSQELAHSEYISMETGAAMVQCTDF